MTKEVFCSSCGKRILVRDFLSPTSDKTRHELLCPDCRAEIRKRKEEASLKLEREKRAAAASADREKFAIKLREYNVVDIEDIRPKDDGVLYILGNGFDLMHGVKSSYYNFRDSMGRNNLLRRTLETYIAVDDVWADFEDSLAHTDIDAMTSYALLDGLLDTFDAYDEASGAAEYYMSVEAAVSPISTIATSLPGRFSKWVDTLKVGTDDRPLKNLIVGGRVLDFNYTEFVETLYGVPRNNVCYVHGSRVGRRNKNAEPLVLGHLPSEDKEFLKGKRKSNVRGRYRREMTEIAVKDALDYITRYDESLTKDTEKILLKNEKFFEESKNVSTVIAIGHSYSAVDAPYYKRIKDVTGYGRDVKWYFGCYGLRDLENLEKLSTSIGLRKEDVTIFRTDTVVATLNEAPPDVKLSRPPREKILCSSSDGKITVSKRKTSLIISDDKSGTYETETFSGVYNATLISDDSRLLVVLNGLYPGILLYENKDDAWRLTGEFKCDHQHLPVPRLKKVYLTEQDITFVYNNRVRKYSLVDCSLVYNRAVRNASAARYDGTDIKNLLLNISD